MNGGQSSMNQKTYDFAHFHMLLTEYITRTNSKNEENYILLEAPYEPLNTPYGFSIYQRMFPVPNEAARNAIESYTHTDPTRSL